MHKSLRSNTEMSNSSEMHTRFSPKPVSAFLRLRWNGSCTNSRCVSLPWDSLRICIKTQPMHRFRKPCSLCPRSDHFLSRTSNRVRPHCLPNRRRLRALVHLGKKTLIIPLRLPDPMVLRAPRAPRLVLELARALGVRRCTWHPVQPLRNRLRPTLSAWTACSAERRPLLRHPSRSILSLTLLVSPFPTPYRLFPCDIALSRFCLVAVLARISTDIVCARAWQALISTTWMMTRNPSRLTIPSSSRRLRNVQQRALVWLLQHRERSLVLLVALAADRRARWRSRAMTRTRSATSMTTRTQKPMRPRNLTMAATAKAASADAATTTPRMTRRLQLRRVRRQRQARARVLVAETRENEKPRAEPAGTRSAARKKPRSQRKPAK